jgi:carboxyl-terminal processing protease
MAADAHPLGTDYRRLVRASRGLRARRRAAAALCMFLAVPVVGCSQPSDAPSAAARAYLERALTALHDHSMDLKPSTWPSIKTRAERLARNARTPADTYAAIRVAIAALRDPHTIFLPPDKARTFNGPDASTFNAPSGALIDHRFALVELPAFEGNDDAIAGYTTDGIRALRRLAAAAPCGWIVDLRGNNGGNMWPMLTVVLPLLRGSPVGYFVDKNGHRTPWNIQRAAVFSGDHQMVPLRNNVRLKAAAPAVAVLQDEATGSSGEAVLVAFRGQPQTKTFGLHSAGAPSGNTLVYLSDGAELLVTEARDADRTGHVYPNLVPIEPDTLIARTTHLPPGQPWHPTAPTAVKDWLATQRPCTAR